MEDNSLIIYMIGACILFIAFVLFAKPLKIFLKFMLRCVLGFFGIYICNFLLMSFNLAVGVNILTLSVVGLLGFPGFIALYIISGLLK